MASTQHVKDDLDEGSRWMSRCRQCEDVQCDKEQCHATVQAALQPWRDVKDRQFEAALQLAAFDRAGNNWKYDACDFCHNEHAGDSYKLQTRGDSSVTFCSVQCMLAVMSRTLANLQQPASQQNNKQ